MEKLLVQLNDVEVSEQAPALHLSLQAYKKMMVWTKQAAYVHKWEVSGLGLCLKKKNIYKVSEVWLIEPSSVGGASVKQDPKAIHALMQKLWMGKGVPKETDSEQVSFEGGKSLRNLRFLWHSHADFGVGWSSVDDENARYDFCQDSEWTINLVINAKGHMLARMDYPQQNNLFVKQARAENLSSIPDTTLHDLPIFLELVLSSKVLERYRTEYLKKHDKFINAKKEEIFYPLGKRVSLPHQFVQRVKRVMSSKVPTGNWNFPDPVPVNSGYSLFEEFGLENPREFEDEGLSLKMDDFKDLDDQDDSTWTKIAEWDA